MDASTAGGHGRVGTERIGAPPAARLARAAGLLIALIALVAPAPALAITEYPVLTGTSGPAGIALGPDGALWFTEENAHKIGRITTDGAIREYPTPAQPSSPSEIAAGPDGALWFTEYGADPPKIGRVTVNGEFNEYPLPPGSGPDGITAGPDGAMWFTESGSNTIGRITLDGATIDHYPLVSGYLPGDITPGPDDRLWFTESEAGKIGAITMSGEITEYDLPFGSDPSGIAASAGAMWFTKFGVDMIGRIPTVGRPITEFGPTGRGPSGIAFGPDGALWFTETGSDRIGRMTTGGSITHFSILTPGSEPGSIVAGPDGAMWFTEFIGNKIGRIEVGGGFVPPPALPPLQIATKPSKSAAKAACRVPAVRRLTVRQARRKLRRAGCRYRLRGKGRVVSSRPRAGARTGQVVVVRAKRARAR